MSQQRSTSCSARGGSSRGVPVSPRRRSPTSCAATSCHRRAPRRLPPAWRPRRLALGPQPRFVRVSRSPPTDTPTRDQVVQYRDVGTRLTIRPTISQDGYVSLLVQQEVNQATSEVQFDAPVISTREAVTQVLVKDGQTIVLGGLRDRQRDVTQTGIAILSGIPIIGGLVRSSDRRKTETELYLFLTPRIIKNDADADSVTAPRLPKGEEL